MDSLRSGVRGKIVNVRFGRRRGAYMYEFKVLTPEGRLKRVYVDAKTIRILRK